MGVHSAPSSSAPPGASQHVEFYSHSPDFHEKTKMSVKSAMSTKHSAKSLSHTEDRGRSSMAIFVLHTLNLGKEKAEHGTGKGVKSARGTRAVTVPRPWLLG